jgi:hypothetical protein
VSSRRVLACIALVSSIAPAVAQSPSSTWKRVTDGVEHLHFTRTAPAGGNWNINVLRVDMAKARLDVVRANDAAIGLEQVTSIAARTKAIAAVNGGYFLTGGDFLGDSTGTLQIDRVLWSEPDRARTSVGIVRQGRSARLIFGQVVWQAAIEAEGQTRQIDAESSARRRRSRHLHAAIRREDDHR